MKKVKVFFLRRNKILRIIFCLNLNKEQKKQFNLKFDKMYKDFKKYRKEDLYELRILKLSFILYLWTILFRTSKILPFTLYFGFFYFIIAIVLSLFILRKELRFIKNYELKDCSLKNKLKFLFLIKSIRFTIWIIGIIFIGGILIMDNIYENFVNESFITNFGKWMGVHKDSPYRKK